MTNPYGPPGPPPPPQWGRPAQGSGRSPGRYVPAEQGLRDGPHAGFGSPAPQSPYGVAAPPYGLPREQASGQEGFGGSAPPPLPPRRRGNIVPWIFGSLLLLILAGVVLVLGFGTPGLLVRTVFDAKAVEAGVRQIVEGSYRVGQVDSATCPPEQPVEPARSFECVVSIGGQDRNVTVTAKDTEGIYEVSRPR